MRKLLKLSANALSISAITALAAAGPALAKKLPKPPAAPNLCAIAGGAVSGAQVQAPCIKLKTAHTKLTLQGETVSSVAYRAQWGTPSTTATPRHFAYIQVVHASGSAGGLVFFKQKYRAMAIGNGLPVNIGKGNIGSILTEPNSCVNPPTEQCVDGTFLGVKGTWAIQVIVSNYPQTIPGAPALELPAQELAATQLEELMKPEVSAIGKRVAAKL